MNKQMVCQIMDGIDILFLFQLFEMFVFFYEHFSLLFVKGLIQKIKRHFVKNYKKT